MKRFPRLFGALANVFLFFCLAAPSYGYENEIHAIAQALAADLASAHQQSATVLDLTDLQGVPTELGRFLAQELSDQLVNAAKSLAIVDRSNLQFLLHENNMSVEGLINPTTSRELGKLVGIDTVIIGTTTPIGGNIRLSVRAINLETGKIISSRSQTIAADNGLEELFHVGVSSQSGGGAPASSAGDLKTRLKADSLILNVDPVLARSEDVGLRFSFGIANHSGVGIYLAVKRNEYTLGPCRGGITGYLDYGENPGVSGVNEVDIGNVTANAGKPALSNFMNWIPQGGVAAGAIQFSRANCAASSLKGLDKVPASVTVILVDGAEVISTTLLAPDVSISHGAQ